MHFLNVAACKIQDIDSIAFFIQNSIRLFDANYFTYVDLDKIDEFKDFIDIKEISSGKYKLPNDFLIKYSKYIDINSYMKFNHNNIDDCVLEKYKNEIKWNNISLYNCFISESSIIKHIDKIADQRFLFSKNAISTRTLIIHFYKFNHLQVLLYINDLFDEGKFLFNKIYKHINLEYIKSQGPDAERLLRELYERHAH